MKTSRILLFCSLFAVEVSAQVFPSWISNNHFPGAGSSTATVVNVDQSGNVFMGGTQGNNFVMKHNPDGDVLWVQTYECGDTISEPPNTLCIDDQGNAYITFMKHTPGGTYWSIAVQKYNGSDGTISWTSELANAQFNGFEWQVKPSYMTIDDNYLYVAGTKFEPGVTGSEMLVMKLNFEGQILWNETISGTGIYANAKSICVDQSGYVYVAGDAWNASIDYCVAKFDPDGSLVWDEFLDGEVFHNTDIAESVIVDDAGNVYITGYNQISSNLTDIVTVKYNQNGVFQWKHSYGNPGYRDNNAYYLAMTEAGDLLVGGYSAYEDPYPGTGKDYILLKYSPSGSLLWDARYDHKNFLNDHPFDFDLGPSGDVYICGITMKSCYSYTFVTIVKINPQGEVDWDVWVPNLYGIPWEIKVIGEDDFVVAAGAFDSIQVNDATAIRYQAGTPVYGADILDIYFESQVLPPVIDHENQRVVATVHDTANLAYLVPFITRSEHSCMYPEDEIITSFIEPVWYNITSFDEETEKWWYVIVEGGYVGTGEKAPGETIQIYPNPTRGVVSLQSSVVGKEIAVVEIIDLYGKSILKWKTEQGTGNTAYDISNLPSGVYFIRIDFEDQTIVKKIVKL